MSFSRFAAALLVATIIAPANIAPASAEQPDSVDVRRQSFSES